MYASPLSVMRLVIKTKSVEFMPFFLSLFVFLCGTSWFIFGLLGHDPFVAIPNGFGCGLGAVQLILYAIYRNCNKTRGPSTATNNTTSGGDDGDNIDDDKPFEISLEKPTQVNTIPMTPPTSHQNGEV